MNKCRIINPNNNIVWDSEIPHNGKFLYLIQTSRFNSILSKEKTE